MTDDEGDVVDLGRLRRSCSGCSLRSLCLPAGIPGDDLDRLDAVARARRASFLHSLSRRLHIAGYFGEDFRLPVSRDDIAGYPGLALETVSRLFGRLFGRLSEEGVIAVERRRVRVLGPVSLASIAGETALEQRGGGGPGRQAN